MKRAIVLLIALAAWAYPLHVASAELTKNKQPELIPVNQAPIEQVNEEVKDPSNELALISANIEKPSIPTIPTQRMGVSNRRNNSSNKGYSGRSYTKEEVQALIVSYSEQYEINPDVPLCIAKLESGYNQFAKNKTSSASGVFQYLAKTWSGTDEARHGSSVFDADANVKAAIKYMASRRNTQPWEVRHKCPSLLQAGTGK